MFFCENTRPKMSADALGYERFPGIMSDRKVPNTLKPSGVGCICHKRSEPTTAQRVADVTGCHLVVSAQP